MVWVMTVSIVHAASPSTMANTSSGACWNAARSDEIECGTDPGADSLSAHDVGEAVVSCGRSRRCTALPRADLWKH